MHVNQNFSLYQNYNILYMRMLWRYMFFTALCICPLKFIHNKELFENAPPYMIIRPWEALT